MSDAVAVILIAAGGALTSFILMNLLAIRPLRRWLSTTSGERLADVLDRGLGQMEKRLDMNERFDTIDQTLDRIEWSVRLISREARKTL